MITSDFHMHSEFSSDSDTKMDAMIERAIELGLSEICFTDHMDYDFPKIIIDKTNPNSYLDFLFDPSKYVTTLESLKKKYCDKIKIRIGVELGLQAHIQAEVSTLMNFYDFDFVIGSSHLLYRNDPYYDSFWNQLGYDYEDVNSTSDFNAKIVKKVIQDYFLDIRNNIDLFSCFQVYGHLDYVVRYAPGNGRFYHVEEHMDLIDEILRKIITSGRGIELNTSGLKNGLGQANPHSKILRRYHELGGEIITVGADAHTPEYVGYHFEKAEKLLRESGFEYYTTFEKKQPIFHKL